MPPILAVTFDCAHTLVHSRWSASGYALDCAEAIGLQFDRQVASEIYDRLVYSRWKAYQTLNQTGDRNQTQAWWREITVDWLNAIGQDTSHTQALMDHSENRLCNPAYGYFEPYTDTLPALDALQAMSIPLAVVSNWDISLHSVLKGYGLNSYFQFSVASLVFGHEKPDPRIFQHALDQLGVPPEHVLHVGDDPIADIQGAQNVGMQTLFIDRNLAERTGNRTNTLLHVGEVVQESRA